MTRPPTSKQQDEQNKLELDRLRKELKKAQQTIEQSRKREKDLVLRLVSIIVVRQKPIYANLTTFR